MNTISPIIDNPAGMQCDNDVFPTGNDYMYIGFGDVNVVC